ncbi:hypothetical protein TrVE_jg12154 [Triparma verrucosa]|uniref:Methyltransferase FkbM domain-containing protein n=1 Tax=Triparma verrucosa TaxID=1606542 RepID=A0A9W6Z6U3_9STRA|nr:hypothetical protein TrVE_jg12154 [Triparma verrucosa]
MTSSAVSSANFRIATIAVALLVGFMAGRWLTTWPDLAAANLSNVIRRDPTPLDVDFFRLQDIYGPLRFAMFQQEPATCNPFVMAFGREGKRITVNDNIWDTALTEPGFHWKYPIEEGFAFEVIMESCVKDENGLTPLVLDAGANMGWFSLSAAACGCEAIAFEPNPVCQEFIGGSAVLNNFGSAVHRRTVAVTDVQQPISFNGWATATDENKLREQPAGNFVDGVRLDDEFQAFSATHYVLYLKVDIQGSEHDAIRGASKLLSSRKVRFVAFEAQLRAAEGSTEDAFKQLCLHGYQCFDVEKPLEMISCSESLSVYRDSRADCKSGDTKCERYIMCAHEKSHEEMLRKRINAMQMEARELRI